MPELPEVETARLAIADAALGRRIVDVDDRDTYECRPHQPGEIRDALVGRTLTAAHRQGKTMWIETSGVGRSRTPGPNLGLHLGMAGRVFITSPSGDRDGGDPIKSRGGGPQKPEWDRFTISFADGGTLRLFDKRRLGRVRLNPDLTLLGPDAFDVSPTEFRSLVERGHAPIKARLLDQSAVAGIGNLLADEVLWQAKISPAAPAGELDRRQVDRLYRALHRSVRSAIDKGGVHTGVMISARKRDAACPRCGAPMSRGTVGGRTTYWCSAEQA